MFSDLETFFFLSLLMQTSNIMSFSLHDLVSCFYGRDVSDKDGQQDPTEYIENFHYAIDHQVYTNETKNQTTI